MTKPRTIEMGQINIAMHEPHSPQAYVDLLQKTFDLRQIFKRGKADGYMLGALYDIKNAVSKNELQGEIYRFTNIDPAAAWFNTQTGKPAEDNETGKIVIPNNLHPNLEQIRFIFRPKEHRFWFVSRDKMARVSPSVVEKLLQQLFKGVIQKHQLPPVEVTVVPDEAAVDEVLSIHRITQIRFEFKRPNADDADDIQRRIMLRMKNRKVNRHIEEMTSNDPKGIVPDDEMKAEAQVAAKNGSVEAKGYDAAGVRTSESTKMKPATYRERLDETLETIWDVLSRRSSQAKT